MPKQDSRACDIIVANLLGLDVLGEAPGRFLFGGWHVDNYGDGEVSHAVYLHYCYCASPEHDKDIVVYFGHSALCLKVVPFYHKHDTLARQALEQICDERQLVAEPYRVPCGEWVVELSSNTDNQEPVAYGSDKSFPLAIVKALAGLGVDG